MKIIRNNTSAFIGFFLLLFSMSCSKTSDESVDPAYVGIWERIWFDKELNANVIQNLIIEKSTFSSTVKVQQSNTDLTYLNYSGSQKVIDNTLEAWITKIGIADNNNNISSISESDNNFRTVVFEKLNIHSNFIGAFFIDNEKLTLRLDMDGDGSVTGDEGLFVFQRK